MYLRELNGSSSDVGLVFSIGFLALALSMIPGGILANKYELKALLIIGWVMSVPPPLMYYLARSWTDVIPGIILLQVSGFNVPAFNAYIAGVADRNKSASNFSITWAAAPLGSVFSPLAGSILLNWIPVRSIFLLTFIFFTISTIVLFYIKPQPKVESNAKTVRLEFPRTVREGTLLLYLTGAALGWSVTQPFLSLYFHDILSLNLSTIQILGAMQYAGAGFFAILLGRAADVRSQGTTMGIGLLVAATGLIGLLSTGNPIFAAPLIFLVGSARAPSLIAYSILSTIRKSASRAGQFGFYLTLESLGFVAGPLVGGYLYTLNPSLLFEVTIVSFVALALLAWIGLKKPASLLSGDSSKPSESIALS